MLIAWKLPKSIAGRTKCSRRPHVVRGPRVSDPVVDGLNPVDEGVGSCRINPLGFADDLVLLASSEQGPQHAHNMFSAACGQAGIKINTENTELLLKHRLSRHPRNTTLKTPTLQTSEAVYAASKGQCTEAGKLKYHGFECTCDARWNKEIDTQIGEANAVLRDSGVTRSLSQGKT